MKRLLLVALSLYALSNLTGCCCNRCGGCCGGGSFGAGYAPAAYPSYQGFGGAPLGGCSSCGS